MTDLFSLDRERAALAIATIVDDLAAKRPITRKVLNAAMTAAYGATDAEGAWTQRDSFEVLEVALARSVAACGDISSKDQILELAELAQTLPTHTVRSEEQLQYQQFSTPIDVAALVRFLAAATVDDIVLEPSAGNGMLASGIPHRKLLLNELEDGRRAHLQATFPGSVVSGHDGAIIDAMLGNGPRPTLVVMNPPFSKTIGRGDDHLAACRHLKAALRALQPGGRAVAVMPDWFAPSARMKQVYETVLAHTSVTTSIRIENCYQKHGVALAIRIYVIDKRPGCITPSTLSRATLKEVLEAIEQPARERPQPKVVTSGRTVGGVGLLRAIKAKPAQPKPKPQFQPVRNEVRPVAYQALNEPAPLLPQVGCYIPYRPSRLVFEKAGEHPTALVESVAMASIPAPKSTYVPNLPERTVQERLLSAAQLETCVYAGHAWQSYLPGTYKLEKDAIELTPDPNGKAYRMGFFLGDGTGAGKGRQVAATIQDSWLQGRRRAIWVTKNEPLLEDARRDWAAIGGLSADIQPITRWTIDRPIELDQGILFVTYPTLRSIRGDHSRLQQIIDWAGPDFDGVIAFDEAHEMGGVAGGEGAMGKKKGSQQGICGVLLQHSLPEARVLYASATGASDVNNLAYAVRLGLWGPHTAFGSREEFISSIRQGGIAAMELVARDLKATGLYMARALSFAGVEYDILKHDLTTEQIEIYDAYAEAWSIIHRNMEKALEATGVVDELEGKTLNSGAKASARSRFESCKQRFFGQLLLSMKLPTVIDAVEKHLAGGESVVLQLVTTAESILDRRLGELSPEERADLEIDLSPREYVIDYLDRAFPTRQMEVRLGDDGQPFSFPMSDADGNPVYNPEAEQARADLIEQLCALPPIKSALDAILDHFGHENVAEVTGRTKRIVTQRDGSQLLESRSSRTGQAEVLAFNSGHKRILVFSDAGGTGRSYHASLDIQNQERRAHFLLEPGWRADRAIQGLGRTHRTHQASTPLFRPVTTNCKGELRFTSTIARRLDSLGALTRGQRQTGGQNLFDPADNLESEYAKAALTTWFHLLHAGKLKSTNLADFQDMTGLELTDNDGILKEDLPTIQRWLNRLLALRIATQNAIFEEFLELIEARVAAARDAGKLDVGVETIVVKSATVVEDRILRTDPNSGATSHLLTFEVTRAQRVTSLDRVLGIADCSDRARYLRNSKSDRVALVVPARSIMQDDGTSIRRFELIRPIRTEYWHADLLLESSWEEIDRATFEALWAAEEATERATDKHEIIRLAAGLLLPIWSSLPSTSLEVNRIVDEQGNSWLGRIVHESDLIGMLKTLGVESEMPLEPRLIIAAARSGQTVQLSRPFPMGVKRSIVNGQERIELVQPPASRLPWLKSLGAFVEVIRYASRTFLPLGEAESILERICGSPGE